MIKAIISDFDGTLVDTFDANFRAYQNAFHDVGLQLTLEQYRAYFGFRFEQFMSAMGICDKQIEERIKDGKTHYYPMYFSFLKPNEALVELITSFKALGGKTAIASTARKENLYNAAEYLQLADKFDLICAGNDVRYGKPSPEIYLKTMETLMVKPEETLIFEDSEVGITAAQVSGAHYLKILI